MCKLTNLNDHSRGDSVISRLPVQIALYSSCLLYAGILIVTDSFDIGLTDHSHLNNNSDREKVWSIKNVDN
jgi:hypothetical protein